MTLLVMTLLKLFHHHWVSGLPSQIVTLVLAPRKKIIIGLLRLLASLQPSWAVPHSFPRINTALQISLISHIAHISTRRTHQLPIPTPIYVHLLLLIDTFGLIIRRGQPRRELSQPHQFGQLLLIFLYSLLRLEYLLRFKFLAVEGLLRICSPGSSSGRGTLDTLGSKALGIRLL